MLALPTAPFAEHLVIDYVRRFCAARPGVTVKADASGNLLAHLRRGTRGIPRPVCLTAHLDHPGFVAERMLGRGRLRATWRGGVPPEYFPGAAVRFWVEGAWVRGRIESTTTVRQFGTLRVGQVRIAVKQPVPPRSIGMWDLPDPVIRGRRIYARGCDDLAGAAAMLDALDRLAGRRQSCEAYFLFTRAEEVGFVGALAAAHAGTIPKRCFVVAMETSSERPFARMGDGVILRAGDKASTFTAAVTAHCQRVATELAARDRAFKFQRKLMDGGTCESSAYCALGYEATGICLALGNYHNVDARRKRIAPEYIDLDDYASAVKWFIALAGSPHRYRGRDEILDRKLDEIRRYYRTLLRASVQGPR